MAKSGRKLLELKHTPVKDELEEFLERKTQNALELLLNYKLALKAYDEIKSARIIARKRFASPPEYTPLLEAMLTQQGIQVSGVTREVALILLDLALHVGNRRGYHPMTAEVAFHIPQTLLGAYLWPTKSRHAQRKGLQRALEELASLGLISYLSRAGTAKKYGRDKDGKIEVVGWMYDGTVFNVRLRPSRSLVRRVTLEDVASRDMRDLDADIKNHRTVEALLRVRTSGAMSQSNYTVGRLVFRKELKEWALPPSLKATEMLTDWDIGPEAVHRAIRNAVQDVKYCPPETRMGFIGAAASVCCKNLMDEHSRWNYFQIFGGARALWEKGQDVFGKLQALIGETLYEYSAGHAKKPGAVLITKLKAAELWDELAEAYKNRTFGRSLSQAPPEGDSS